MAPSNTSKAIAEITDPGDFETLAIQAVRQMKPEFSDVLQTGINIDGKPIKGQLDGFALIPYSDPPHYVMIESTTFEDAKIKKKWLNNNTLSNPSSDDGDLVKAAHQAMDIRNTTPDSRFTVFLCTNKKIGYNLAKETTSIAKSYSIDVIIIDNEKLTDHLDNTREGQLLRRNKLGIDIEEISEGLLRDISNNCLQEYKKNLFRFNEDSFVKTPAYTKLGYIVQQHSPLSIISGPSGYGKSVLAYKVLSEHIINNGFGLWINERTISDQITLWQAIEKTLKLFEPKLSLGSGQDLLEMIEPSDKLFIVIDDLNKCDKPSLYLENIIKWFLYEPNETENPESSKIQLIIPIWDLFLEKIDSELVKKSNLKIISVTTMEEPDAVICLKNYLGDSQQDFEEEQLINIVNNLGCDPILINLFSNNPDIYKNDLLTMDNVLNNYIEAELKKIDSSNKYNHQDYMVTLTDLTIKLLLKKILNPSWREILCWFEADTINLIRAVVSSGLLCKITQDGSFAFKHDRIRDYFICEAIKQMLDKQNDYVDTLTDPYFIDYISHSFSRYQITNDNIDWFSKNAPLVLVRSIQHIKNSKEQTIRIIPEVKEWIDNKNISNYFDREASIILNNIDSNLILDITSNKNNNPYYQSCRFYNGDIFAGVAEFSKFGSNINLYDTPLNKSTITHFANKYKDIALKTLPSMLKKDNLKPYEIIAVFNLSGYLGFPELCKHIKNCWDSIEDKNTILLSTIWALSRCCYENPKDILSPILEYWKSIPNEDQKQDVTKRSIAEELRFIWQNYRLTNSALEYFINFSMQDKNFEFSMRWALSHVDDPKATMFIIGAEARHNTSIFFRVCFHSWNSETKSNGIFISENSKNALFKCWNDTNNSDKLQSHAFYAWLKLANLEDIQIVEKKHKYFLDIVNKRIQMGDRKVIPFALELFKTNNHNMSRYSKIWGKELIPYISKSLEIICNDLSPKPEENFNDLNMIPELLRDIPIKDAESLLLKYWDKLRLAPPMVQAALYIGTEETLSLAKEELNNNPASNIYFKHLGFYFGFFTKGLSDRIKQKHLNILSRFLSRFDNVLLDMIASFCKKYRYIDWSTEYIKPELERRKESFSSEKETRDPKDILNKQFPTDDNFIEELNKNEKKDNYRFTLYHYYNWFEARNDPHNEWNRVLDLWLSQSLSKKRFIIVAHLIKLNGLRTDLLFLEKHLNSKMNRTLLE